jgi:hypothetical protein
LGLEFAIAGSPGWSESGGPWVKPEQAMKKLVWTETRVNGGTAIAGRLPRPPSIVGPFQDVPVDRGINSPGGPPPIEPVPDLYRDVAVLAYRLPDDDRSMAELHPIVTSSSGVVGEDILWDGEFTRAINLPYDQEGKQAWIQIDFGHPQTVQSMTLGLQGGTGSALAPPHVGAELDSSVDGNVFRRATTAYDTADYPVGSSPPIEETVTFAPVTAQYFRLLLPTPPSAQLPPSVASLVGPAPAEHRITEFVLHPTPQVNHFELKAGYFLDSGLDSHPTLHVKAREVIDPSEVIDLSAQLHADGTLNWTPPPGRWAVLRIGYSLLGITNHPASPEGTGLEVDKLSRSAVKAYMDDYLGRYESFLGPKLIGSHGLRAMVNDSWEAGPQNWTDELPAEFAQRRGYDLHHWLPALTGRIVGSAEATDKFLWDFRRTLGDLLAEYHYGQISTSLHARGMIHYGESHEVSREFIGDGMDVKRDDDVPMGAMWVPNLFIHQEQCDPDIRESASVAHLYGQNLVAAESMTAFGLPGPGTAYAYAPESLKSTADRELADGLNLFVVHTSVHQPLADQPPGLTLGPFGQWFTRFDTWSEQATLWVTYLSRSSYLLQQGHFAADILYYYGQDSNITALYENHLPPIPEGYAFDFANAHALTVLSVRDHYLVSTGGMRYRLLVLDPRARVMSLDVLRKLAQLVEAGATIVGDKPQTTPSLTDSDKEFHALADTLWDSSVTGRHQIGRGLILSGKSLPDAIVDLKLEPDFSYSKPRADTTVWFLHRRLHNSDVYFVNNRQARAEQMEARFRVVGKAPEFWHADTGVIEPASYREEGDYTAVPLSLDPYDAVFVVFRRRSSLRERKVLEPIRVPLVTMSGPWHVHFQPGRGAPDQVTFTELKSWTADSDPRVKYFSGTASYEANLNLLGSWLKKGQRVEIDLGTVKNLAEVLVNGESAGIAWKQPFRLDVTDLLKSGSNSLAIRVTNLWVNRLIGDKQPKATPIASTSFNPYIADSPLLDSGLFGPVMILSVRTGDHR